MRFLSPYRAWRIFLVSSQVAAVTAAPHQHLWLTSQIAFEEYVLIYGGQSGVLIDGGFELLSELGPRFHISSKRLELYRGHNVQGRAVHIEILD
jgi:hypothetical protein